LNLLFAAAADLQRFFDELGWKFCFIGGLAVQRWGEPRLTQDVDATLLTGFGSESDYVDPLLEKYSGRIQDARVSPCAAASSCCLTRATSRSTSLWPQYPSRSGSSHGPPAGASPVTSRCGPAVPRI
jgi:hypothetical protein